MRRMWLKRRLQRRALPARPAGKEGFSAPAPCVATVPGAETLAAAAAAAVAVATATNRLRHRCGLVAHEEHGGRRQQMLERE